MNRLYGINVVNLLPWSYGPGGMKRAIKLAGKAGFDGIQFLPLRGWKTTKLESYESKVISYQDAWNFGTFWETAARQLFGRKQGPLFSNWVLFVNRASPVFTNAVFNAVKTTGYISVKFALEIHPGLSTDIETYVILCEKGYHVCWDTWHARRPGFDPDDRIEDWEKLLDQLPNGAIRLIHVHLFPWELTRFLQGSGTTVNMLKRLKQKAPLAPAIIEFDGIKPINVLNQLFDPRKYVVEFFSEIREATKEYLG